MTCVRRDMYDDASGLASTREWEAGCRGQGRSSVQAVALEELTLKQGNVGAREQQCDADFCASKE